MVAITLEEKTESLEDRLNNLGESVRQRFIDELLKPKIIPRDVIEGRKELTDKAAQNLLQIRYMKDFHLLQYIVRRLEEDGVDLKVACGSYAFQDNTYNTVTKEPMKRVFYGQFNADVPREIMQELTPWVAFYLYAGIWNKKATPLIHRRFTRNNLKNQPIYNTVRDCVMEGLRTVKKVHNRKHEEGKYKHWIKAAPHYKEITNMMPIPRTKHYAELQLPLLFPSN